MEKILIEKLKNNDPKALDLIIEKYSSYIFTVAKNFSQNMLSEEDIQEIVCDVFISLWKNKDKIISEKPIVPYLSMIAKNCVKNKFRHNSKRDCLFLKDNFPDKDFFENFEKNLAVEYVFEAMENLSEMHKEIFIRYYFYGEKVLDISNLLTISESNVKISLHRARKKVKKFLAERGFK